MKHKINVEADMATDIFRNAYLPLKESMGLDWPEFNKLLIYMGLISGLPMWKNGIDILKEKGSIPKQVDSHDLTVEMMHRVIADLLETVHKIETKSNCLKDFIGRLSKIQQGKANDRM